MTQALETKIAFTIAILLSTIGATALPLITKKNEKLQQFSPYANVFAAGIFIAVAMIDLLPHGHHELHNKTDFEELAFLLSILGYALVFFVEKIFTHKLGLHAEQSTIQPQQQFQAVVTHEQVQQEQELGASQENEEERTEKIQKSTRAVTLSIALSIHAVFGGIVLGILDEVDEIVSIGIGILAHKIPEAIALGIALLETQKSVYVLSFSIFCLATPLGAGIGLGLESVGNDVLVGVLTSLCSGMFLYVVCTEILVEEFVKPNRYFTKFALFLIGIAVFTVIAVTVGSHEHEDEDDEHDEHDEHDH